MRLNQVNRLVKDYQSDLFAERAPGGWIGVYRKKTRWESVMIGKDRLTYSCPSSSLLFALTEDWSERGMPVEWGLEPILDKLKEGDPNRDPYILDRIRAERERIEELENRARRNELRAQAYDMRSTFAKVTNDINTSTLEKVDPRRKQDGYCK